MNRPVVYFVGGEDDGPIKIGTTADLAKRLPSIQTGNPARLVVHAAIQGDQRLERDLHDRLRDARLEGEWFDREAALTLLDYLIGDGLPFEEPELEDDAGNPAPWEDGPDDELELAIFVASLRRAVSE